MSWAVGYIFFAWHIFDNIIFCFVICTKLSRLILVSEEQAPAGWRKENRNSKSGEHFLLNSLVISKKPGNWAFIRTAHVKAHTGLQKCSSVIAKGQSSQARSDLHHCVPAAQLHQTALFRKRRTGSLITSARETEKQNLICTLCMRFLFPPREIISGRNCSTQERS